MLGTLTLTLTRSIRAWNSSLKSENETTSIFPSANINLWSLDGARAVEYQQAGNRQRQFRWYNAEDRDIRELIAGAAGGVVF